MARHGQVHADDRLAPCICQGATRRPCPSGEALPPEPATVCTGVRPAAQVVPVRSPVLLVCISSADTGDDPVKHCAQTQCAWADSNCRHPL